MYYGGINPKNNHSLTFTNDRMITPQNEISSPKKTKKSVTFNNKVDVVNVESFKEFNKIDEDEFNLNFFQRYNFSTDYNNEIKNKQKDCECTCIIY